MSSMLQHMKARNRTAFGLDASHGFDSYVKYGDHAVVSRTRRPPFIVLTRQRVEA